MTREGNVKVLENQRNKIEEISNIKEYIKDLRGKLTTVSAIKYDEPRVQSSPNNDTKYSILIAEIVKYETRIEILSINSFEYIKIITNPNLDIIEKLALEGYYGKGLSYRRTSLRILKQEGLNYDHKTIKNIIEKAIDKISNVSPHSPL